MCSKSLTADQVCLGPSVLQQHTLQHLLVGLAATGLAA
jgi:hypothetical protein